MNNSFAVSAQSILISMLVLVAGVTFAADPPPAACDTPAHREFDFWVGDWEVHHADGKPAGSSRIETILAGCFVFENWQSASSQYAGKSFNTFDTFTGNWSQVWVDTGGNTIHFSGRRKGNLMDMTGRQTTAQGTVFFRMTYTLNDDGTVRQLWQQSKDQKVWEVIFDGLYRRKL